MHYITNDDNEYGVILNGKFKAYGKDITVLDFSKNRETNEVTINCVFAVGKGKTKVKLPLDDKLIKNLQRLSYPATTNKEQQLREYIDQQISDLDCKLLHSRIGWEFEDGVLGFKGCQSLGYKQISRYDGTLNIAPHSTLEEFREDFSKVIEGKTKLEFAFVMGLTGCLVGYLNCVCAERIDTLIYDIYGGSTTGKTTIMRLAVSTCGNPDNKVNEETLFANCSATKNAFVAKLHENYGMFVGYDEVGRLSEKTNIGDIIYQIADGTGKARCNKYGDIMETNTWTTACGFTGEMSILELTENKDGLLNRVFSFDNVTWTADENQATEIDAFVHKHSALPVYALVKHLLKCSTEDIANEYNSIVTELQDILPVKKEYKNRAAKKSAVVILTARHTAKALKVNISDESVKRFLIGNAFSEFQLEHERAYARFVSLFYTNISLFSNRIPHSTVTYSNNSNDYPNLSAKIGYYTYHEKEMYNYYECHLEYCVISKDIFESWMKKSGFSNISGILRKWRELKILDCEPDRLAEPRCLVNGGSKVPSYKIIFNSDSEKPIPKPWALAFARDIDKYLGISNSETEKNCGASMVEEVILGRIDPNFYDLIEKQYLPGNCDFQALIVRFFQSKVDKIFSVNGRTTKTGRIDNLSQVDKNNQEIINECEKNGYNVDWRYGAAFKGAFKNEGKTSDTSSELIISDD